MIKNNTLQKEELIFLQQSNLIEGESGDLNSSALVDAIKAWSFAKEQFKKNKGKLNISLILGIHKRLLQRLAPHYAGMIRDGPVYIGGECRDQTKEEITAELNELCEQWNELLKYPLLGDEDEFVKQWHIGFEMTHFASDGNGRTGRILMNLQRLHLGFSLLIIHCGLEQQKYYKWFKK